jgi:hypothetical protein
MPCDYHFVASACIFQWGYNNSQFVLESSDLGYEFVHAIIPTFTGMMYIVMQD